MPDTLEGSLNWARLKERSGTGKYFQQVYMGER